MGARRLEPSRTGKGNILNISLIAFRDEDYPLLEQSVTVERVTQLFSSTLTRPVERYEVPGLGALNFVLHRSANESVTRSLALDAHGKTLSFVLLKMDLDV